MLQTDIGGKVGFSVDFANDTILVSTESLPTPTPQPISTVDVSEPLPELKVEQRDGVQYVSQHDINDMLKAIGLDNFFIAGHAFYNEDDVLNPLLKDIPIHEQAIDLIPLDYYNSTIVPLINSLR